MVLIQELNEFERDALREISNVCIQNSNTSLSKLIKQPIKLSSAQAHDIRYGEFMQKASNDRKIITTYAESSKELPFQSIFYLKPKDTQNLIGTIFNRFNIEENEELTNFTRSAIMELVNMYNNSFFKTLASLLNISLMGDRLIIAKETENVVFDYVFQRVYRKYNYPKDTRIIYFSGEIDIAGSGIYANYLFIPEPPTDEKIIKCVKEITKKYGQ